MDTNRHESEDLEKTFFLGEEVHQLAGCVLEVLKGIGPGLHATLAREHIVL